MFLNLDQKALEKIAIIDSNFQKCTYGDLCTFAQNWIDIIHERCLIMILGDNTVGAVAGYLACVITKKVPLIVSSSIKSDALTHLKDTYSPQYIWAPKSICTNPEHIIYEQYDYVLTKECGTIYPLYKELSLLLTTSGSTGSPKLVRHSYRNLEIQAENVSEFFELKSEDHALVSLPIQYTMAISAINSHLYVGATLLMTDLSLLSPKFWSFVREQKASSITGVPYSFEIMNRLKIYKQSFPDLKLLTQGGGKLPADIQVRFAEYIHQNGGKYIATYGQTEGTARMAYLPDEFSISKCGSIGKAIPNGQITVVDTEGKEILEPNQVGEMVFKGENVTLGYAECGEDLIKGDENSGILYTGDLVYKDEDGFIFIVGRKKRFLKLFGHRVSLDECEQLIKNKFHIECACTGTDKVLKIYITDPQYVEPIKEYILQTTELYANILKCIVIDMIPKNEAGKTLYSQLS